MHNSERPCALQGPSPSLLKIAYKRVLRRLSSLPLAISEMGAIAALSAVGTVIEQNKPIQFYIDNYPDGQQKARPPFAASRLSEWPSSAVPTGSCCQCVFQKQLRHAATADRLIRILYTVRQGVWHSSGATLQHLPQPSKRANSNSYFELADVLWNGGNGSH